MTSNEFRAKYWGPANKRNLERLCAAVGIVSFAGVPVKRLGWTGFVNALGDHQRLDVRDFTCEAAFIEALSNKCLTSY